MNTFARFISPYIYILRIFFTSHRNLYIFWNINNYRPRSSGSRNIKSFLDNSSKILSLSDSYTIFTYAVCYTYDINFLKRIISHKIKRNLSCKTYKRNTVIVCRCDTCNKICRSRSTRHKTNTGLSC